MKKRSALWFTPIVLSLLILPPQALASEVAGFLWRGATWVTLAGLGYTNAFRADSMRMSFGSFDDHDALQIEANFRYDIGEFEPVFSGLDIKPFIDVSYSAWQMLKEDGISMTNKGNALGIAPGFRFQWDGLLIHFVDVRAGISLLAPTTLENNDGTTREFGGNLTFSEQFALGGFFSDKKGWEWSLGVQHHSNHNIYEKNNGIEFYNITLGYNY